MNIQDGKLPLVFYASSEVLNKVTDTLTQNDFNSPAAAVQNTIKSIPEDVDITEIELKEFSNILMDFQDRWLNPSTGMCNTHAMSLRVNGEPKRFRARDAPGPLLVEIHKQIDDLERKGVIVSALRMGGPLHDRS